MSIRRCDWVDPYPQTTWLPVCDDDQGGCGWVGREWPTWRLAAHALLRHWREVRHPEAEIDTQEYNGGHV